MDFSKDFNANQFGKEMTAEEKKQEQAKQEKEPLSFDFGSKLTADMLKQQNGEDDEATKRLIAPGVYDFSVYAAKPGVADKGKFKGFNKVTVVLKIDPHDGNDTKVKVFDTFPLVDKMMWKTARFIDSVGMFEDATKYGMEWDQYVGETGKCEIETNEYNGRKSNRVKKYILPGEQSVK